MADHVLQTLKLIVQLEGSMITKHVEKYEYMNICWQTYVQDMMRGEAKALYKQLVCDGGHFYVCGDVTMAEHVLQTLKVIV